MPIEGKPSPAAIAEFKRLFNIARREFGTSAAAESPSFQAALNWATSHSIEAGKALLDAVVASQEGRDEAGLALLERASGPAKAELTGYLEHAKGFSLERLKRIDEAIACYEKALSTAGYDSPGPTLINLALIHVERGNLARVREYFNKALEIGGRFRAQALTGLGTTFYLENDYNRAIAYWLEAANDPENDAREDALYNLGIVALSKNDGVQALEYFEMVLAQQPGPRQAATRLKTLNAMALTLHSMGQVDRALSVVEKALALPDQEQEHERAKNIRTQILAAKAKIKPSEEESALVAPKVSSQGMDTPESRMKQKLLGKDDKYSEYIKKENSKRDNSFSVLRGWSSAVTLLEGGTGKQWRGGGYFLKWRSRGLVLDPGFDFIDNFHDAGFHAREVDAVIVSHNHPDHNFDLGGLDDLRFEIFRRELKQLANKTTAPSLPPALFAIDEDTAEIFRDDSPKHRGKPVRFSGSDYERKRWLDKENDLPFRIEHFPVQHGKDVPNALGFRLALYNDANGTVEFSIGYTGDTAYFTADPARGDLGLADQLAGCDLLLAHISQPMTQELDDPHFPKPLHLGYNGVARLLSEVKPKLTLIGEFWAGLADLRLDLVQGLRRRCGTDAILPTGLGFHLSLPSLEIECTRCRLFVPFPQIKVAPPTTPFGPLGYLCPKCLV